MSFILGLMAAGMSYHLLRTKQPVNAKGWLVAFYIGLFIWQIENVIRYSAPLEYYGSTIYKIQTIF
ncbi:MAG TPA: hypothetical protein VM888_02530, partial [Chitinophagaceae bacterium]|nr:hypothetical protein [Chitinophagaceae bacterium]